MLMMKKNQKNRKKFHKKSKKCKKMKKMQKFENFDKNGPQKTSKNDQNLSIFIKKWGSKKGQKSGIFAPTPRGCILHIFRKI